MSHSLPSVSTFPPQESFWVAGRRGPLLAAFLLTEAGFMVWILLGTLSIHIARDLGLDAGEIGLMTGMPILTGTLLRLPVGMMADRLGPKKTGIAVMSLVLCAMCLFWLYVPMNFIILLVAGAFLGLAGTVFSVAIPLVSRHFPPELQGAALGVTAVAGAGTVVSALVGPMLADAFGWQKVFGWALVPTLLAMVVFWWLGEDHHLPPRTERTHVSGWQVLRYPESLWFSWFYAVTFGGFIGLTTSLVLFFHTQFQIEPATAGAMTACCVLGGALFRPVGGHLADRFGGIRTLQSAFLATIAAMALLVLMGQQPLFAWLGLLIAMSALGLGNGALFQLIPLRFPRRMGTVAGLVGTAGGIGGFLLAWGLGVLKQNTGEFKIGFLVLGALALLGLTGLVIVKQRWRTTWGAPSQTRGRV
ncbi:MAG: MFS transporter [Magnetococcus sp. YQC-5]